MFKCLECSRKFRTTKAAERAANSGCPGCGGVDIDLDVAAVSDPVQAWTENYSKRAQRDGDNFLDHDFSMNG